MPIVENPVSENTGKITMGAQNVRDARDALLRFPYMQMYLWARDCGADASDIRRVRGRVADLIEEAEQALTRAADLLDQVRHTATQFNDLATEARSGVRY